MQADRACHFLRLPYIRAAKIAPPLQRRCRSKAGASLGKASFCFDSSRARHSSSSSAATTFCSPRGHSRVDWMVMLQRHLLRPAFSCGQHSQWQLTEPTHPSPTSTLSGVQRWQCHGYARRTPSQTRARHHDDVSLAEIALGAEWPPPGTEAGSALPISQPVTLPLVVHFNSLPTSPASG